MALRIGTPIPSLDGAVEWANGEPVAHAALAGRPTLVHFWSVSCHSCHETMPVVREWHQHFGEHGLQLIGVHQPRSEAETVPETVKQAIAELELVHPIAIDSACLVVERLQNRFVPAFYLFDAEGKLRHYQAGERAHRMVQPAIERLLGEKSA
ncbi:MAG: redoxin domain-containing protein [Armatimonadota bacterium]|nr:redoxin domain-containing protein [Armatimonadota bacterium]